MKKFRIVIITPFGAEPRCDNYAEFILARGLSKMGHDIHFYTYKMRGNSHYRKDCIYKGIKVFRCRQRFGISPGLFFSIINFRPDIIIFFHT